jgi:hypothetical protein
MIKLATFLKTVNELKRRFSTLALMWKAKRDQVDEEDNEVLDFEDLI